MLRVESALNVYEKYMLLGVPSILLNFFNCSTVCNTLPHNRIYHRNDNGKFLDPLKGFYPVIISFNIAFICIDIDFVLRKSLLTLYFSIIMNIDIFIVSLHIVIFPLLDLYFYTKPIVCWMCTNGSFRLKRHHLFKVVIDIDYVINIC